MDDAWIAMLAGLAVVGWAGWRISAARRAPSVPRRGPGAEPRLRLVSSQPERLGEDALRAVFERRSQFVGRNLEYVAMRAGRHMSHDDFDGGVAVYTWTRPGLRIDVWFKNGICTEVKVQDLLA